MPNLPVEGKSTIVESVRLDAVRGAWGAAASLFIALVFFRVVKTTLSSSYNISGLVPVCWLLFQCF